MCGWFITKNKTKFDDAMKVVDWQTKNLIDLNGLQ